MKHRSLPLLVAPVSAPPAAVALPVATGYVGPRARKFVPYAERVAYAGSGRHHVAVRRARSLSELKRALVSAARDLGHLAHGLFAFAAA